MIRPLASFIGLVGLLLPSPVPQSPLPIARRTGTFHDRRLDESSGVIVSRKFPGLLWTMNDSGGEPALFLTDTAGAALGVYPVIGAGNVDWESLGRGPCGREECLYVGDTGDNGERRPSVVIYRLPEPDPAAGGTPSAPPPRGAPLGPLPRPTP